MAGANHQMVVRLTELDVAILDATKEQQGFVTRSDALRHILRRWGRENLPAQALATTPPAASSPRAKTKKGR
jgi:hypothetical protein